MLDTTIEKKFHFYASHRNEAMTDKCKNLHGHTYKVIVGLVFGDHEIAVDSGITRSFEFIDNICEPLFKEMDHGVFVNKNDKELKQCIKQFPNVFGKVYELESFTSVENLGKHIGKRLQETELKNHLKFISILETETSKVTVTF